MLCHEQKCKSAQWGAVLDHRCHLRPQPRSATYIIRLGRRQVDWATVQPSSANDASGYACPYRDRMACRLTGGSKEGAEDPSDKEESSKSAKHAAISASQCRHVSNMLPHSGNGAGKLRIDRLARDGSAAAEVISTYLRQGRSMLQEDLLSGEGRMRSGDSACMLRALPAPTMAEPAWALSALRHSSFALLPPRLTNDNSIPGEKIPATEASLRSVALLTYLFKVGQVTDLPHALAALPLLPAAACE